MTRFTETQAFPILAYGILGASAVAVASTAMPWAVAVMGLTLNLLCLRTTVTDTDVAVTFGALVPLYGRRIARSDIADAQAVTYAPLAEYGGWGVRGWGANTALNARGDRGVRLTLQDGRCILVGSQRPKELAEALAASH